MSTGVAFSSSVSRSSLQEGRVKLRAKTKEELIREIARLQDRVTGLESLEANRRLLEYALDKSETKFRTLTERSVVGVYLIQDGLFRYVNPKLAEIFGYHPEQVIDTAPPAQLVFEEDRPLLEDNLQKRLSGRVDAINYQFRGLRRDGSVIHVEVYGSRMEFGGAPAVIGSLVDITRRIRSEGALRESERRYKTLVEEINDGYFVVQNERIIFANQAFCRMHGVPIEKVLNQHFLTFVSPDNREHLQKAYEATLQGRPGAGPTEFARLGVPPEKSATEIRARVIEFSEGPALIGICRDISERVAMQAKVREHERLAYVGHLSASLSHEIRNPLSSIKMNLQILARKLDLEGFDRRRLEISVHEVSRLEGILRQLLDTARPLTIEPTPVDLSALARGCIDLLEPKAQEKRIEMMQSYQDNLPMTKLDAGKLEQALINLLLNAIEATPEGGCIMVWTKTSKGNGTGYLELGVRDTGPGIERDLIPNLFTPFHTSKSQGTGLGLSNVKRIVEAHSGKIEVRSREGRGAAFIMRLPCSL